MRTIRRPKKKKKKKEAALSYRGKQLAQEDDQWVLLVMSGTFDPEGIDRRQTRRKSRRSEIRRETLRRARSRRRRENAS